MTTFSRSKWMVGLGTFAVVAALFAVTVASPSIGIGQETDGTGTGADDAAAPPASQPGGDVGAGAQPPASLPNAGGGSGTTSSGAMPYLIGLSLVSLTLAGGGYFWLRRREVSS